MRKNMAFALANSGPTEDTLRQCGHLANAFCNILKRNVSWQCTQVTRHMPGTWGIGGVTGLGAKFITLLQFIRGQAIRCDVLLQIKRQWHKQRTYFLPAGALLIGVASLQRLHFTTCCSLLPITSIISWQTLHVTLEAAFSGPISGTVKSEFSFGTLLDNVLESIMDEEGESASEAFWAVISLLSNSGFVSVIFPRSAIGNDNKSTVLYNAPRYCSYYYYYYCYRTASTMRTNAADGGNAVTNENGLRNTKVETKSWKLKSTTRLPYTAGGGGGGVSKLRCRVTANN